MSQSLFSGYCGHRSLQGEFLLFFGFCPFKDFVVSYQGPNNFCVDG